MSDLYVDPLYWDFGYAVGDLNLQPIGAEPVVTAVTATGGLGYVRSLSAFLTQNDSAVLNEFTPNSALLAGVANKAATSATSAALSVERFVFVSGEVVCSSAASASAAVGKPVAVVASAVAGASGAVALSVPLAGEETTASASTAAVLLIAVDLVGSVNAAATAGATATVGKPVVASSLSSVNTFATALLGKRLDGSVSTACSAAASAAIAKAMASSLEVSASAAAVSSVEKRMAAAAVALATTVTPLGVGKPIAGASTTATTTFGRTVLLRFVDVEVATGSSYEATTGDIYADHELLYKSSAAAIWATTVDVYDPSASATVSVGDITATAEVVYELDFEATW